METLGRARMIWWVVMFCKVVGGPPRVDERSWPGAERTEGHGGRLELGADEAWADLSRKHSAISSAFFQRCLALLPEV